MVRSAKLFSESALISGEDTPSTFFGLGDTTDRNNAISERTSRFFEKLKTAVVIDSWPQKVQPKMLSEKPLQLIQLFFSIREILFEFFFEFSQSFFERAEIKTIFNDFRYTISATVLTRSRLPNSPWPLAIPDAVIVARAPAESIGGSILSQIHEIAKSSEVQPNILFFQSICSPGLAEFSKQQSSGWEVGREQRRCFL